MDVLIKNKPPIRSSIYDHYWHFAKKRQDIFFSRIQNNNHPWTDDEVLNTFKFTNAYRASDRVSQYLIKNVIYKGDQSFEEVFFRCILFKLFNKIETWELLEKHLGEIRFSDYRFNRYDHALTNAMSRGERIYSAAYIMPSRGIKTTHNKKHRMHLELINKMLKDSLPSRISNARSLEEVYKLFLGYPGIGNFLAYQYTIDINYSEITDFNEMDFIIAGPGAKNGIKKCFRETNDLTDEYIIKYVTDRQENEFKALNLNFKDLWGRPLQLIDCQNLFCEVDKYTRVAFPEYSVLTGRYRIKQKFNRNPHPISFWYPPKWGLNNRIKDQV